MMVLNYGRSVLLSNFSTTSASQPLSCVVWRNLVNNGAAHTRPTRRGCRAGRMKRRSIPTIVTYSRQNRGEQNLSEVGELNIQLDTFQSASSCTVVQRSPLLPGQKERSSL